MNEWFLLTAENFGTKGNLENWAGKVTLSGLLIVFGMLVVLIVIFSIFGALMQSGKKKPTTVKEIKKPEQKVTQVKPKAAPVVSSEIDDGEVIAAISAAVAMMYEGTGKTPVIRSIKPAVKGTRSAWAMAGIVNNTRAF